MRLPTLLITIVVVNLLAASLVITSNALAGDDVPEFEISALEENVYLHKSYRQVDGFGLVSANGLVVVHEQMAYIVDTPWSEADTQQLVDWISQQGVDLAGSISTHSHADRTAGIKWLNQRNIATYASAQTNHFLEQRGEETANNTLDVPAATVLDGLLETYYPGGGHTADNVVVWLPKSKILFGGCLIRSLEANTLGYTGEAALDQWANSVNRVKTRYQDAKLVVPGHGKAGDINLLKHTIQLAN
ncbi:DIM/SIM/IMP family subclass B1 metallo-beta-lactamase [Arenicella xantha]|uniref:beta-lactamase n=1 Tax=Arenicella xantha TaxID=644221 RepID=A0A395JG01_9GAMM|nr:DIM/SIM/IMP family subclass B1 metallo-beta-lactamase [Arenicella xantha]RBP48733.1 metallo-beta-lactamase class B/metallo-beta-lactamase class B GIM [Arenicella xantha]